MVLSNVLLGALYEEDFLLGTNGTLSRIDHFTDFIRSFRSEGGSGGPASSAGHRSTVASISGGRDERDYCAALSCGGGELQDLRLKVAP